ncbi:MAG: outer membrane beta-barrel protein [Gemmatimonadales bacterium]
MRIPARAFGLALALLPALAGAAAAQSSADAFKWYFGGDAGFLVFETPTQSTGGIPAFGGHLLVMSRKVGLQVGYETGWGSDETSAYPDATQLGGAVGVTFDRTNRIYGTMVAYPVRWNFEPYLGVGYGISWLSGLEVNGTFASDLEAQEALEEATDRGSQGFGHFMAGAQIRAGHFVVFGQWMVTTSNSGALLTGATHSLMGGARLSLGSAREGYDIR